MYFYCLFQFPYLWIPCQIQLHEDILYRCQKIMIFHCIDNIRRTTYTYENLDFRMFPGIQRDSDEWRSLYKIRTIVERVIDHLKINMCVVGRKSLNHTPQKQMFFLPGLQANSLSLLPTT